MNRVVSAFHLLSAILVENKTRAQGQPGILRPIWHYGVR